MIMNINEFINYMLNSSRNVFVIILKLKFLEIKQKKHIPKSRGSFYIKSDIFHEPGSPKDTQTPCWLRTCRRVNPSNAEATFVKSTGMQTI